MSGMPRIEALTIWETDLLEQLEYDYEGLCRNLGGRPFAILCKPGRERRYRRLGELCGLVVLPSPEVSKQDGFLLIHEGEASKYLPNFRVPEVGRGL